MATSERTQLDVARIPCRATQALIADALAAAGLPPVDAARCAELMTQADLTGADGHGIFRLPQYVRRLTAGGFNKRPNITVSRTAPATALVDGDNGMGHLVMSRAAGEATRWRGRPAPPGSACAAPTMPGRRVSTRKCRLRPG